MPVLYLNGTKIKFCEDGEFKGCHIGKQLMQIGRLAWPSLNTVRGRIYGARSETRKRRQSKISASTSLAETTQAGKIITFSAENVKDRNNFVGLHHTIVHVSCLPWSREFDYQNAGESHKCGV